MVLILDLIVIIFIVIISFLFCTSYYKPKNTTYNYSCLISHIVVGLSVIVFYRLALQLKLNDVLNNNSNNSNNNSNNSKEHFDSMNDFISGNNDFILPSQVGALSSTQISDYSNKLDTIINNLNNLQQTQSTVNPLANVNPANLNTLDLSAQQQYQIFQIDYLNKQISNAQDVINAETVSDTKTNYKPIKVFSSCIVANADGTITKDVPISNQSQSQTQSNNSSAANNMLKAIGQTSSSELFKSTTQLSPNTGLFNNILSNIQKSGIVNIQ